MGELLIVPSLCRKTKLFPVGSHVSKNCINDSRAEKYICLFLIIKTILILVCFDFNFFNNKNYFDIVFNNKNTFNIVFISTGKSNDVPFVFVARTIKRNNACTLREVFFQIPFKLKGIRS